MGQQRRRFAGRPKFDWAVAGGGRRDGDAGVAIPVAVNTDARGIEQHDAVVSLDESSRDS